MNVDTALLQRELPEPIRVGMVELGHRSGHCSATGNAGAGHASGGHREPDSRARGTGFPRGRLSGMAPGHVGTSAEAAINRAFRY